MFTTMFDIVQVTPASFPSFVSSADFALLRVDTTPPVVPKLVVDHLKAEYPSKFAFGALRRDDAPLIVWWNKHFSTVIGTLTSIWEVPTGYYLFHHGKLAFRHSGTKRRSPEEVTVSLGIHLAGLIFDAPSVNKAVAKNTQTEDINALLSDVEAAIAQIRRREEFTRRFFGPTPQAEAPTKPRTTEHAPPPSATPDPEPPVEAASRKARTSETKPPNPKATSRKRAPRKKQVLDDPYAILGIQSDASDEDVKKAYRQKIALTHPDKVAHLSDTLRKTADKETRRITKAYETITKGRKGL